MTQPLIIAITYLQVYNSHTIHFADAHSMPLPSIGWDCLPTRLTDTALPDTLEFSHHSFCRQP